MQSEASPYKTEIKSALVWSVAVPLLAVWALVSFFPMFGTVGAYGDVVAVLIELAFLSTGALALIAAVVMGKLLRSPTAPAATVASPQTRLKRLIFVTMYALFWLTAYGIYHWKI